MSALMGKQAAFGVAARSQKRVQATRQVAVAAAGRPVWFPDVAPPSHLTGKLAGDRGFDPLGLGQDPDRLKWYAEAEKTNGRWAMTAVAGILATEALGLGPWWSAGARDYWLPITPQVAVLFIVMGFLETKRYAGFKETGTSGFINSFPFDPLGQNSPSSQEKEIKNGRLAMVAFVGFAVQALVSHTQPIEGLTKHLANPTGRNITYYITHLPEVMNGTA